MNKAVTKRITGRNVHEASVRGRTPTPWDNLSATSKERYEHTAANLNAQFFAEDQQDDPYYQARELGRQIAEEKREEGIDTLSYQDFVCAWEYHMDLDRNPFDYEEHDDEGTNTYQALLLSAHAYVEAGGTITYQYIP